VASNNNRRSFVLALDDSVAGTDRGCWFVSSRVNRGECDNYPQGLKPGSFGGFCGTTEVVPFQNRSTNAFFSKL
jgi:hypothetical protein